MQNKVSAALAKRWWRYTHFAIG